ncbi:MAG: hypothetical protein CMF62_01550 [Magnetococcales bacterium]|nr:hypothetical protein [Magnetococcales bacterium]
MTGGAKKEEEKANHSKESREEFKFVMHVSSTHIKQDGKELKYEAKVSKTPAIRLHFKTEQVKVASIVKRILSYVNKRLRMTDVKEVHFKMGKETMKFKGDKLDEMMDVSKEPKVSELNVVMSHTPRQPSS